MLFDWCVALCFVAKCSRRNVVIHRPPAFTEIVALLPDETKKQAGFCWMFAVVQWFESFKKDISLSLSLSLASPSLLASMLKEFFASTAKLLGTFGRPFETCCYCVRWRWSRDTLVLPHKYKNHAPIKRNERFWRLSQCFSFIINFAYLLPQVLCLGLCLEWLFVVNAVPSLQTNENYSIQLFCLYAECEALVVKANWSSRYQIFSLALPFFFFFFVCSRVTNLWRKKKGTIVPKATAFGVKAFSVSFFLSVECVWQIKL